jgi:ketosteroid isomerase-like protein
VNPRTHLDTFFEAWMKYDASALAMFYAPDAIMEDPTFTAPLRGQQEIREYYRDMFASIDKPEHDLVMWSASEPHIWFEWTFVAAAGGVKGRTHHGVSIQTLRDGLIVVDRAFWMPRD